MRRWTVLLLSLLMCFGSMLPIALASPTAVNASYDKITGKVTISGTMGNKEGSIVTVQVRNPYNQMEYLDQAISSARGAYQFNFTLKQRVNGTYIVSVGGENADAVAGATFYVAPTQAPTVNVSFDDSTGKVTISGLMGTVEGNLVNVQVRNPLNGIDYLDQGKSSVNGIYQFSYILSNRIGGVYTVSVWGQDASLVQTATFTIVFNSYRPSSSSPASSGTAQPPATSEAASSGEGMKLVLKAQLDPKTHIATAHLDATQYSAALQKAKEAGVQVIPLEIPKVEGAEQYELIVSPDFFLSKSSINLSITTDFATLIVPATMLSNVRLAAAKEIGLRVGLLDSAGLPDEVKSKIGDRPVIELNVIVDGQRVPYNNPDSSVTISIPYQPTAEELQDVEHIIVWYVDQQGAIQAVPTGKYDAAHGVVTFKTSHFSAYAVNYIYTSFKDLDSVVWAQRPIEVMASKGIISGISDTMFNPEANITRADFMILLTKSLGLNATLQANFNDVATSDYYYDAVGIAKQLGLADGQGDNRFNPRAPISRQDMMVLISRALKQTGKWNATGSEEDLTSFVDGSKVASYAASDIAAMVKAGVVEGSGNTLNPLGNATRAEAAVLLYRIYNK